MATSHHDPWKRGKPTGIGRDSTAEGGITKETNAEAVTRKAAAAAARMAEQLGEKGKLCRAAHHHVRRLEFGAGRPMGSWDLIGGKEKHTPSVGRMEDRAAAAAARMAKQLNMGTLESRNTISFANSRKGVASPPPTYQTNSLTWAAFGGPQSSSKQQTNTGFLGVQLSLSHVRQLTQPVPTVRPHFG